MKINLNMNKKRNPIVEVGGETIEIGLDDFNPMQFAPWYNQLMSLEEKDRKRIVATALSRIKEVRPETFRFLMEYRCKLVGIIPAVEYTLTKKDEGELDITFSHAFSMPTLLFWCKQGKFAIMVNANLEYNDTVLNKIRGNKKESIRGFTG